MTRALSYAFAALVAALGAYVIVADVHANHVASRSTLVSGCVMLFVAGLIVDKGDMLAAAGQIVDALKAFFGRGNA